MEGAARVGGWGNAHTVLVLELGKDHLKDPDVDGWIILMWILK